MTQTASLDGVPPRPVLSADVSPEQIQWAVVDIAADTPAPQVHLPAVWSPAQALS